MFSPTTTTNSGVRPRLDAVDATRTMAIIGMFVVHLAGVAADRWGFLQWARGYASGGFATLAGVSLGLTGRTVSRDWRVWPPQLVRSALLFALGVWLAWISFAPIVILCVYAVLFLVALPFRRLSGPALMVLGLTLTVVSPVVSLWLRRGVLSDAVAPGYAVDWQMLTGPDPVPVVLRTLFVDGVYPIMTWLPLALVGWGAQRCGLFEPRRVRALALAAVLLVMAGFGVSALVEAVTHSRAELIAAPPAESLVTDGAGNRVVVVKPIGSIDDALGVPVSTEWKVLLTGGHHSGTTFELWQILAVTAGLMLGFSLLTRLAQVGAGIVRVVGWPGRIPLTVYAGHIVVGWQLAERPFWDGLDAAGRAWLLASFIVGAFMVGAVFRHHRGPLEWVLHRAARLASAATGDRAPQHELRRRSADSPAS